MKLNNLTEVYNLYGKRKDIVEALDIMEFSNIKFRGLEYYKNIMEKLHRFPPAIITIMNEYREEIFEIIIDGLERKLVEIDEELTKLGITEIEPQKAEPKNDDCGLHKISDIKKSKLHDILVNMQVPAMRMNLDKEENIRWLSRNLGIKNGEHQEILTAIDLIKSILKEKI